jgi:anti-sigma B factor antagonist
MLDIISKNGTLVGTVHNTDRITAANAAELKSQLNELLNKPSQKLVLDMQHIKFIDSTGIGTLISALKTARQSDGTFQLSALQKDVFNLLTLMKLDKVFDILPDTTK